ncbi:hypothetical protein CYMTET_33451 [Cymbomonas tetramitiformis]|uniref:CHAD domain-containing protein n=1 Tax=Cymbomonas tetramitiformis TaxID=36881 RepID=A0AAE0FD37_9CHLO|nr:hypothetical protein CYMTET_33451 [Cymbomonas tetramitiformis]
MLNDLRLSHIAPTPAWLGVRSTSLSAHLVPPLFQRRAAFVAAKISSNASGKVAGFNRDSFRVPVTRLEVLNSGNQLGASGEVKEDGGGVGEEKMTKERRANTKAETTNGNLLDIDKKKKSMRGKKKKKSSKRHPPISTVSSGTYLSAEVQKPLRKLKKLARGDLRDVETVHDLRVGLRRMRAALRDLSFVLTVPEQAKPERISKTLRHLGSYRDYDVVIDLLTQISLTAKIPKSESKVLQGRLDDLKSRQLQVMKKMPIKSTAQNAMSVLLAIEKWHKSPRLCGVDKDVRPVVLVAPHLLSAKVNTVFLHDGWFVEVPKPLTPETAKLLEDDINEYQIGLRRHPAHNEEEVLHALRKEVKGLRYLMEFFKALYPDNRAYDEYLSSVVELNSAMGDLQDVHTLHTFIDDDKWLQKEVPVFSKAVASYTATKWAKWLVLRRSCTSVEYRASMMDAMLYPHTYHRTPDPTSAEYEI